MRLSGWGRYPKINAIVNFPSTILDLKKMIKKKSIARGNGRSYGDSSISKNSTICMKNFNKILKFDKKTGLLVVESGVLLSDIIDHFLPMGWFPRVTPGSKYVTIGGMVACDVHGKNHHKDGSFGKYIKWLEIITTNGKIKKCSRKNNTKLFNWTIGGMGLTGVILSVAFYLRPIKTSWIKQKTIPTNNLDHTIEIFEKNLNSTYTVAWIDSLSQGSELGRSLIMLGEHARILDLDSKKRKNPLLMKKKKNFSIPFDFPSFVLNSFTIKIFNFFYYFFNSKILKSKLVYYDTFFYPLDYIINWNKIYGHKGFAQFQCVIPLKNASSGIRELLELISKLKSASFLAVLKRFGEQNSFLSFPMKGYTLALDFPITKKNLELMKQLDKITIKHKGRFYLAKDSRLNKNDLKKSDIRFIKFCKFRTANMKKQFSSSQSKRLEL